MISIATRYTNWCEENSFIAWPASLKSLGGYICYKVDSLKGSAKSVNNNISAIKNVGLLCDIPWISISEELKLNKVKDMLRLEDPYPVQRKEPFLLDMIEFLLSNKSLDIDNNPKDLLIACMMLLSHNGLLRSIELLSGIKVEDMVWNLKLRNICINIGPTKTDRIGCGVQITITDYSNRPSAYLYLYKWFQRYNLWNKKNLFVFPYSFKATKNRQAYFDFELTASPKWWESVVARLGEMLGRPKLQISKHSFRAGGCTDLFALGVSYATIKKYGRWKSDAVLIYLRSEITNSRTVATAFGRGTYDSYRGQHGMGVDLSEDL